MDNNIRNTGYNNMVPENDNNVYSDNNAGQSYVVADASQQQVMDSTMVNQQGDTVQQTMNVYQEQVVQPDYQAVDPNQTVYQGQTAYPAADPNQVMYQEQTVQPSYQGVDPNQAMYQGQTAYPAADPNQVMYQTQTVQPSYQTVDPNQTMYQGHAAYPTTDSNQVMYQAQTVQPSYQTIDPNQAMYQGQTAYQAFDPNQAMYQTQTVQPSYQTIDPNQAMYQGQAAYPAVNQNQVMYQSQHVQNAYPAPNQNVQTNVTVQQQNTYQNQAGYSMPNQGTYTNNVVQGVPNIGGVPVLPTANNYPSLGAIQQQNGAQPQQYNANMIQTGPTAFQNTGASQVGSMQTAIRRKNPLNDPPPKKPFPIKKILFFLLVAITVAFVYYYFFYDETTRALSANLNSIFDTNKPVLIKHPGKLYGYIKTNGEVIVEPQYEAGTEFYGGYAGVVLSYADEEYAIINKKGEAVVSTVGGAEPKYLIDCDTWIIGEDAYSGRMKKIHDDNTSVEHLEDGLFSFKNMEKEQSGIMNYEGEVLYTTSGIEGVELAVSYSSYNKDDVFVLVSTPEKTYIVSTKTLDTVYTFEDPSLKVVAYDNGIFSASNNSASDDDYSDYFYFHNGEFVFEIHDIEYMYLIDYEKQIVMMGYGSSVQYYDVLNKVETSAPEDFSIYDILFEDYGKDYGYEIFSCNDDDYEGVMQEGEIVLECENDYVEFLPFYLFKYIKSRKGQELTFLKRDDNKILYDLKLKRDVEEWGYAKHDTFSNSVIVLLEKYDDADYLVSNGYIVYNLLTGKYLEFDKVLSISISASSFKVYEDLETVKYYNAKMEEIYEVSYS